MLETKYVRMKNDNLEEEVMGINNEYPYMSFYAKINNYIGGWVPWHWHKELEFFFVIKGKFQLLTEQGVKVFREGDGGFINSNVLHAEKPVGHEPAVINSQLLDKRFIAGHQGSLLERKYMTPIIEADELNVIALKNEIKEHQRILDLLHAAYECDRERSLGYEMQIRNFLSDAWLILYQTTEEIWKNTKAKNNIDSIRIKNMLSYINEHFAEKVALKNIAQAANISEREALRCFKRCVRITPFEYLLNRRLQEAADLLLGSDESIVMIGEMCGFSSPSYFGKVFKEHLHCTPKQYRKKSKSE